MYRKKEMCIRDRHNALHAFCDANGAYHLMGCMLSAASCNKWWMDEIIGTKDYKKEQEAITKPVSYTHLDASNSKIKIKR